MQPNKIESLECLLKAEEDLKSAKVLVENSIIQTSLYHSQQCAEKTLKAILIYYDQVVPKTHDLTHLSKLAILLTPQCEISIKDSIFMTSYSWKYRYPGEGDDPDLSDAEEAIDAAETLLNDIKSNGLI
jgi:HEPN domain-containing protein